MGGRNLRKLWPHQEQGLQRLRQSLFDGKRRPLVQAPTGAGKTLLAAAIVESARRKGRRVMFCVPALELINQTINAFWDEGIKEIGVMQAQHDMTDCTQPVQIASVQTLARRAKPDVDVVIIDEAHRVFESVTKWLASDEMRDIPVIGLSATPWTKGLGKIYDDLIIVATTEELIEKGMLSPFKVYAAAHPDLTGVRTVAGDYHEGDLSKAMDKPDLTADVVSTWKALGENRSTLVFAVDRAHAARLQKDFEAGGIKTGYIDAYTPVDARKAIRDAFHRGEVRVVCNVNCLTMGVDWDVRCIVLARPTKSEMLFCLDSETEILTSHGWKGMGAVKLGDCAAACRDGNPKNGVWSQVVGMMDRDMCPTEKWVSYDAPRANFRVTDQHRMLFISGNDRGGEYKFGTALAMASAKGGARMPTAVHIDQPGTPLTDAELYFIGMMMTDGTWTSSSGSICQSERHPQILGKIEASLRACGIGYRKTPIKSPKATDVIVERHKRWRYNLAAGSPKTKIGVGRFAPNKGSIRVDGVRGFRHLLPFMDKDLAPALMALSRAQFEILLDGIWDGDGFKKLNVDYTPQSREICTSRKMMANRLQALGAINGYTVHSRLEATERENPLFLLTFTPKDWRSCGGYASEGRNQRPTIEVGSATQERVWCVETTAGTIVTRRRGKVTVMGNCQMIGRGLRTAEGKDYCKIFDHSDSHLRLGFVTDIHHDKLNDGQFSSVENKSREALPKECPKCHFLKPPKVSKCPVCGFAPARQSDVVVGDGQLVEVARHADKIEKQRWYSMLRMIAQQRGYKLGWAANKYRTKFGVWPFAGISETTVTPSTDVSSWVQSQQIAWAKSKHNPTNQATA